MLDANDKETFFSLRLLRDVVDRRQKPIIIWVGAGVSKWCGFATWHETAEHLVRSYRRYERGFDNAEGLRLLQQDRFPDLFEIFRHLLIGV
jgi:hypothetical protein